MRNDGKDISLIQEFCLLAHLFICLKKLSTGNYSSIPAINTEGSVETKQKDTFKFPSFLKKGNFLQRWTKALKVTVTPKECGRRDGALDCNLREGLTQYLPFALWYISLTQTLPTNLVGCSGQ